MIYIFEGSDLSGKTTLADKFARAYDFPIIKKRFDVLKEGMSRNLLNSNSIEDIQKFFWLTIFPLRTHLDFVIDRSLLSSLVYGAFFKREFDRDYILTALRDPFVKVFFIYANSDSIERRKTIRTEKYFELDEILKIQTMYFQVVEMLEKDGIKIVSIDNSDNVDINIPEL